jgi:predicted HTH transcriptional regulator
MMFGIFGGVLLSSLGIFTIGMSFGTLVSSLLGANVIELIAKKFGWSKKMDVVVSDQQLGFADLGNRQINALQYVQAKGRITNREYQRINRTTNNVAKHELQSLVEKKKLKKAGANKGAYYVSA